jgi:hypothetical protein
MLINPLITIYLRLRLLVVMPVAVEKLAPGVFPKCEEILIRGAN